MVLPALFFFLRIAFNFWSLLLYYVNFRISFGSFCLSKKCSISSKLYIILAWSCLYTLIIPLISRICSDVTFFSPDICNLCLPSFIVLWFKIWPLLVNVLCAIGKSAYFSFWRLYIFKHQLSQFDWWGWLTLRFLQIF